MNISRRFRKGLKIRREVVGDARVAASLELPDPFSMPIQEIMTAFAWGEIWARTSALDRRIKSIATISMLIALNRPDELGVHVRGAMNNGVSEEEIREIILHSAVYCGFPAALQATGIAKSIIETTRAKPGVEELP